MNEAQDKLLRTFVMTSQNDLLCKVVGACISNLRFTILINGESTNFFPSSQGIRQGCPLCPSLFILIAEGLSRLVNFKVRGGVVKGIKITSNINNVNHSQFADDTLMMGEALVRNAKEFKDAKGFTPSLSGRRRLSCSGHPGEIRSATYGKGRRFSKAKRLVPSSTLNPIQELFHNGVIPKIKTFNWLLAHQAVLTAENLHKQGIQEIGQRTLVNQIPGAVGGPILSPLVRKLEKEFHYKVNLKKTERKKKKNLLDVSSANLFFDADSLGNPGNAGAGGVIIFKEKNLKIRTRTGEGDSLKILTDFKEWEIHHIPREYNQEADTLAKQAAFLNLALETVELAPFGIGDDKRGAGSVLCLAEGSRDSFFSG
eukprot:Gb_10431 [translate_table: standard]